MINLIILMINLIILMINLIILIFIINRQFLINYLLKILYHHYQYLYEFYLINILVIFHINLINL